MLTTIIIIGVLFILFLIYGITQNKKQADSINQKITEIKTTGFVFQHIAEVRQRFVIGLDKDRRQGAIIKAEAGRIRKNIFDFAAIRDCEIIKDGETIYKKSALRTVGGAVVGGVLLGGAGAVIGGLSGGSKGIEKIKGLNLKISINSIDEPAIHLPFIDNLTLESEKKGRVQLAETWNDRFSAIIDENEHLKGQTAVVEAPPTLSQADEIKKFKELLDAGAITQEEFETSKKRILQ